MFCIQDAFQLHTPGGGAYGTPVIEDNKICEEEDCGVKTKTFIERGSVFEYRQLQESV